MGCVNCLVTKILKFFLKKIEDRRKKLINIAFHWFIFLTELNQK